MTQIWPLWPLWTWLSSHGPDHGRALGPKLRTAKPTAVGPFSEELQEAQLDLKTPGSEAASQDLCWGYPLRGNLHFEPGPWLHPLLPSSVWWSFKFSMLARLSVRVSCQHTSLTIFPVFTFERKPDLVMTIACCKSFWLYKGLEGLEGWALGDYDVPTCCNANQFPSTAMRVVAIAGDVHNSTHFSW